ncbi:MAG: hypothetical protein K2M17_02335, partial [Bacilli bacterium]|nr:hypothetical protein [Bacilli bacterium]
LVTLLLMPKTNKRNQFLSLVLLSSNFGWKRFYTPPPIEIDFTQFSSGTQIYNYLNQNYKWCFDPSNINLKKCDFTNYAGNGYKWLRYGNIDKTYISESSIFDLLFSEFQPVRLDVAFFTPETYAVYKKKMGYLSLAYGQPSRNWDVFYSQALLEVCKQWYTETDAPNAYKEGFATWPTTTGVRTIIKKFTAGTNKYYSITMKASEGYRLIYRIPMMFRFLCWKDTNNGTGYHWPIYIGKLKLSFTKE